MNVNNFRIPWAALRSGVNCGPSLVTVIKNILTEIGVEYPTAPPCCVEECATDGFIQPWYPILNLDHITDDAGDIDVTLTSAVTEIFTGDLNPPTVFTVPDGTKVGQMKTIRNSYQSEGTEATIRTVTFIDGTEDTDFFLNNGGFVTLMWGCNSAWILIDYVETTN